MWMNTEWYQAADAIPRQIRSVAVVEITAMNCPKWSRRTAWQCCRTSLGITEVSQGGVGVACGERMQGLGLVQGTCLAALSLVVKERPGLCPACSWYLPDPGSSLFWSLCDGLFRKTQGPSQDFLPGGVGRALCCSQVGMEGWDIRGWEELICSRLLMGRVGTV